MKGRCQRCSTRNMDTWQKYCGLLNGLSTLMYSIHNGETLAHFQRSETTTEIIKSTEIDFLNTITYIYEARLFTVKETHVGNLIQAPIRMTYLVLIKPPLAQCLGLVTQMTL